MSEIKSVICDQCGKISNDYRERTVWVQILLDKTNVVIIRINSIDVLVKDNKDFCSNDCFIKLVTGEPNENPKN